jgi:predicted nucleotidyltransferase
MMIFMRLSEFERETLKRAAIESFGGDVRLRLFGSRADDARKGGDIDLLVNTTQTDPAAIAKAHTRFVGAVYARLGEQKLDVLIDYPGRTYRPPIFNVAQQEGVVL